MMKSTINKAKMLIDITTSYEKFKKGTNSTTATNHQKESPITLEYALNTLIIIHILLSLFVNS